MVEHEASGHDFIVCGKMQMEEHEASGHDFIVYGKMQMEEHEASGHDFSRAANATKYMLGFSP